MINMTTTIHYRVITNDVREEFEVEFTAEDEYGYDDDYEHFLEENCLEIGDELVDFWVEESE